MLENERCLLTTKDFTILEVMLDRGQEAALTQLIRRKLDHATVIFREDVPAGIVTLNSRVSYRVGNAAPETRIVSQSRLNGLVGFVLPLTTLRGLALLGLAEGQSITVTTVDGETEMLSVEQVLFQPEAASRTLAHERSRGRRPRLVYDADALPSAIVADDPFEKPVPDDPGPSAA
ncbi:nucleoside-diphosphate kinase [Mesorhizobium sp. BAC0120]|uniref:nucleoside-diphosphate kinase n=1 Tax=Mesorhizobium sp. BAC0120 TaxID=3090670 RepID=UPI00298D2853|nr:nucleoside-diphosphate kinase [Mesorhizobium sp. BAC0120]MDW6022246.1 nucleoside-diphosphate kinase [Mesorhizobium sp. BAC0120]